MLTVEKIGGTSMTALDTVIQNIILHKRASDALYNRVFIVSAFSGVTNTLLENKKTREPGVYHKLARQHNFHRPLKALVAKLKEINRSYAALGLDLAIADPFIERHVAKAQSYLDNLSGILASGYVEKGDILLAAREILASIGETHSAFVLTNILQNKGINTTFLDLSGFGDIRELTIDQRIKDAFRNIDLEKTVCIVTGYTKGTEGIMREFDRGYSEVTFSKVATHLKPVEAIIHKEYHLSTADPGLVGAQNAKPVGNTNYDIADQLADVGMEAIHPKAAKPLEMAGISLRIKNTFQPDHSGTLITTDYISPAKRVEVITGTNQLVLIDVYDPLMVGHVGSDLAIMTIFAKHNVSYTFKATNANSISIVIWEQDTSKALIKDLSADFEKVTTLDVAMVCLLGTNMDQPGLLARISTALTEAGINILSAGFALRKVNFQFLVSRKDFNQAVIALNQELG